MELTRKARRKIEDLEEMLAEVNEVLGGHAGDEPEDDVSDVIEATDAIKVSVEELRDEISTMRRSLKDLPDGAILGAIKKLTEKVGTFESSIRSVTTWEASAKGAADRMASVAQQLVNLDRVQEFTARSVVVVFDRGGPPHAYLAVLPATGQGLAAARMLRDTNPKSLMVSTAIWQGALKIGEAVD